jgi:hypothetical protein
MTDPYAMWDAAYVLGSLSGTERREYEDHLSGCPECRSAISELSGMPALLKSLRHDDVASIDDGRLDTPPAHLLDGLLAEVSRRRARVRRKSWMLAASAAAAVVAALLLVLRPGPAAPPTDQPAIAAPASMSMTPVAPSSLEATVLVTNQGWGTHIAMSCTYRPDGGATDDPGDRLAMVAVGRDGTRTQLATWVAREGDTASPSGSTSMPVDQIAAVQIVAADTGAVLLQRSL